MISGNYCCGDRNCATIEKTPAGLVKHELGSFRSWWQKIPCYILQSNLAIFFFFAIVGQVIDFRNISMILKSWKFFIIILTKGVEENMEINSISALLSLLLPGNSQLGQTTCPMKMDDIPAFHKWKHIFSTAIVLFPQVASVNKQFILHWQDNLVFYKSFDVIKKNQQSWRVVQSGPMTLWERISFKLH